MRYRYIVALLLVGLELTPAAMAADKAAVDRVIELVRKNPETKKEPPREKLTLRRNGKYFDIIIYTAADDTVHFGIESSITIGAAESDYNMDTWCEQVRLTDLNADGTVDGHDLSCEAWTPTQGPFITKNRQRLFDKWVAEIAALLQ